jgi:hypothetical protein
MPTPTHSKLGDPLEAAIAFMEPYVYDIIERIDADEFTTVDFIEAMQLDPDVRAAYERTVTEWHEGDEHAAKMVVHGQVIPTLLRKSGKLEWAGFAHGIPDDYAVPAWWRRIEGSGNGDPLSNPAPE